MAEFDLDQLCDSRGFLIDSQVWNAEIAQALAAEEEIEGHKPTDDLLAMHGMSESIAYALAERGVSTPDDLAELAADEISDIEDMGMERASAFILAARASEIARLEQSN